VTTPVAVFDSGIAPVSDLDVRPGVNCTATVDTSDRYGHGTHVAGIIGAKDNSEGVVGVAPGAPLYPVKVLDDTGAGSDASILCGIEGAMTTGRLLGVTIANLSLGAEGFDDGRCGLDQKDPVHLAVCKATDAGVLFVTAAGNAGADLRFTVPAAYDEVLTVTWMNDYDGSTSSTAAPAACAGFGTDDTYSYDSNFAGDPADQAHTIAAPGSCILSTAIAGGTAVASGSSMAAPHVAGTVAVCVDVAACSGPPGQVIQQIRSIAAARPSSYGFNGDPAHPLSAAVYYGSLVYAGAY